MSSTKQTVPFNGTKAQEEQLIKVIAELKSEPGALMPIMQKAQEIYGYLPIEVQTIISVGKDLRCGNILLSVCLESKRKVPDIRLSWHCVLCERVRRCL